jgi:hypothetical protein
MRMFAVRFACSGVATVLALAVVALPADASVCTRDVPSVAALAPLIGKLSQAPQCAPGGANGQVEVDVTGSKGSVGFFAYPATKAHIVQPQIEAEFQGKLHEKHVPALGTSGAVWTYHGAPADAWLERGGQFVWVDATLTSSKDVVRLAYKIYAKIG